MAYGHLASQLRNKVLQFFSTSPTVRVANNNLKQKPSFCLTFSNEMDAPHTLPLRYTSASARPILVITNASRSKRIPTARSSHLGTSSRRVARGPAGKYTRVVLRRDDIPVVAQAYFAAARDTLDATRVGNRGAIMTKKGSHTSEMAMRTQVRQQDCRRERRGKRRKIRRTRCRMRDNRRSCSDPPTDRHTRMRQCRVRRARGTLSATRGNAPLRAILGSPCPSGPRGLRRQRPYRSLPERSALLQTASRGP